MRKLLEHTVSLACWTFLFLLLAIAASRPSFSSVLVTPNSATMLVGETRSFRLVDQEGHMVHRVSWTISDSDAFLVDDSDELTITSKVAGNFRIDARSESGGGEATVKVMEGQSLPQGTKIWSSGNRGCKTTKIIPAVPSAGGPDIYEQSECEDGTYVTAYTAEGLQMWRRKIGDSRVPPAAQNAKIEKATESPNSPTLNLHTASICDSLSIGTDQQKIFDLVRQRNLSVSERTPGDHAWVIEETSMQCNLWFDDKLLLAKKRKILVSD